MNEARQGWAVGFYHGFAAAPSPRSHGTVGSDARARTWVCALNGVVRWQAREREIDGRDGGLMEKADPECGVPVRHIARKVPSGKTRFLRIIVVIRRTEFARPPADGRPAQWCWSTTRRSA